MKTTKGVLQNIIMTEYVDHEAMPGLPTLLRFHMENCVGLSVQYK